MKKIFGMVNIILVVFLAGCGIVERFQLAEQQYLETRVEELMEEMPVEEETPEPAPTQEEKEAEAEEAVDHAFRQSLTLIGVFLGGSFVTGLLYQWAKQKLFAPGTRSTEA